MLSNLRSTAARALRPPALYQSPIRHARSQYTPAASSSKRAGDISDAFASMSSDFTPLPPRFAKIKQDLIRGNETDVIASWNRLLDHLREELPIIHARGPSVVPEVSFEDVRREAVRPGFEEEYRKRGVVVVRGVVPEEEALGWKESIKEYIRQNPNTKAFPADDPQVFELYWSRAQLLARSRPSFLLIQKYLLSFWHSHDPSAPLSLSHPTTYADRLRIRQPGDARFALGPHIDGGSVERWEPAGYGGREGTYHDIFVGDWDLKYDPWAANRRLKVNSDLYQGVGACGIFRAAQGWMSMSSTGPGEGTLKVFPDLKASTAYLLLRPFFEPVSSEKDIGKAAFLDRRNWRLEPRSSSLIQGATPGFGQELKEQWHPHLELAKSMVNVPRVRPGDFVAWHCDTIHSVDQRHEGSSDSSVLYIPVCPLTVSNATFLAKQRETFISGIPSPDFGGSEGESNHVGRPTVDDAVEMMDEEGLRAFGLKGWNSSEEGLSLGQKEVMNQANEVLGFRTRT